MHHPDRRPAQPLKLHDFAPSGHCHRVRLMLSLLGLPYESIAVDLLSGEQRRPPFLALNAFGQVPVLQDGAVTLADSNAILVYLASKYGDESWLPSAPVQAAAVQRWLSVAAGEIAYGPGAARAQVLFKMPGDAQECIKRAQRLLVVMDQELQQRPFLTGATPTIADVAGYSYIAHAPEGGVALEPYPHVRAWLV
ncbi:MAG TPA: glutathione S-transferase, partial [Polyangiales bacterium]|nr:glutathione S-transferase [Polyangiales bacterium]